MEELSNRLNDLYNTIIELLEDIMKRVNGIYEEEDEVFKDRVVALIEDLETLVIGIEAFGNEDYLEEIKNNIWILENMINFLEGDNTDGLKSTIQFDLYPFLEDLNTKFKN